MSQSEITPNKPVHLIYLTGAILTFFVATWLIEWVWGTFAVAPGTWVGVIAAVITVVATLALYRHAQVNRLATEVAEEIARVDWPSAKEVKKNTWVVIATAIIAAIILVVFDSFWSVLTELIYG